MTWRAIHQHTLVDPRLASQPAEVRDLFTRLVVFADSHGRLVGHPLSLQHQLSLYGWTPTETAQRLAMLCAVDLVKWYGTTEHDSIIEVLGFDATQHIRSKGAPQLPARQSHHADGVEVFAHLVLNPCGTGAAPVQHQCSTSADPVLPTDNTDNTIHEKNAAIETVALHFAQCAQHKRTTLNARDQKRLTLVLQEFTVGDVCEYLTTALDGGWYWDVKRGAQRRRNAIPTLFNIKPDKAGRTFKDKIRGHWPDKVTPQPTAKETAQQRQTLATTLNGEW